MHYLFIAIREKYAFLVNSKLSNCHWNRIVFDEDAKWVTKMTQAVMKPVIFVTRPQKEVYCLTIKPGCPPNGP
ncbi:MAG: hypothetical protein CVV06_04280 [Gammaproteobacteria bacterium HGW-Gammaproteobacteria-10]|nr:MAG: hypothetical protein CVV06_04280 [Gammaproteobacteria bacterium HGW-Gammaproteobacteria-10]